MPSSSTPNAPPPTSHNHYTFTYALKACCLLHARNKAQEIHAHVLKSDVVSWTSMISGLAKCGFVEEAILKFMSMDVEPNYATLVMLCLLVQRGGWLCPRGFCEEAVRLFQQMVQRGEAVPNEATIVNASHMFFDWGIEFRAVVFKGLDCKDIISWSTIISGMALEWPWCACIAALFAYASHGIPPDDVTFLGLIVPKTQHYACLGDLLKSRGVSTGTYALLSNTYANHDRWDDANKVRDEMRRMGLKKLPGCSRIEVDPSISQ
ncbi:unnamed protein product [Prunus armeniaca]|uniref:Pentatricopeptide repeat-containing protein n=1 Tax=Prunus armeniaca TaxID=36596 RepID=A0A6J5X4B3_PRUAR|nr:unnamed protein product [Prunus armeniaca]